MLLVTEFRVLMNISAPGDKFTFNGSRPFSDFQLKGVLVAPNAGMLIAAASAVAEMVFTVDVIFIRPPFKSTYSVQQSPSRNLGSAACAPLQKGLFRDLPQRHRVMRLRIS